MTELTALTDFSVAYPVEYFWCRQLLLDVRILRNGMCYPLKNPLSAILNWGIQGRG